jgi:hypothetical protein
MTLYCCYKIIFVRVDGPSDKFNFGGFVVMPLEGKRYIIG